MNKIKIDNYYKPESKTLRLDEVDYTIIPNSDIKLLLDKLEQENKILKENAEHNDKVVDKVNWENMLLKKNKQLKDNWNKLKEYLHNQIPTDKTVLTKHIKIFELLDKMQEIEQGSDSNENNNI